MTRNRTDGWTDGRTDGRTGQKHYTLRNFVAWGIITKWHNFATVLADYEDFRLRTIPIKVLSYLNPQFQRRRFLYDFL